MIREDFQSLRRLLGLVSVAVLLAVPLETLAQPAPPDPIFANGFELPNAPPVADAGIDQTATVGVALPLDGSGSFDPDGDALDYSWSVLARPEESGAEVFNGDQVDPVLIPDRPGVYTVQLVVSDGALFSESATINVTAFGTLSSSAIVGSAGGAVGLPDGASVLIPPTALSTDTTITITEVPLPIGAILPPTGVLTGSVYEMTPAQQSFQRSVRVVIPYDASLLPAGYEEGAISIHRSEGWPEFNQVGSSEYDGDLPHSDGQIQYPDQNLLSVLSTTFSNYAAVGVRSSTHFTPVTLTTAQGSVIVRRPPTMRTTVPDYHNCKAPGGVPNNTQLNLTARPASQIAGIAIHSTNSGNVNKIFNYELGWATNDCNQAFTHYYIDRDGSIYQVADDLLVTYHVAGGNFGLDNDTTIGIELFDNVGEPYDGRQISAMIRLVDFLMERYGLPRPQRDPATGIVRRNRVHISQGGDRIVAHMDVVSAKCDPSGTFMDSGLIKPEHLNVLCKKLDPRVTPKPLSVGDSSAPALMDMLLDAIAVLARDEQHTGIINTQGGDSFWVANAGDAGAVTVREDAALVGTVLGVAERTRWEENEPTLLGPGPLIVAPGATISLTGPMVEYTDVIVAGTLNLTGDIEFHVTGSVYVSPLGRIIARDGRSGGDITVYSRGTPFLQGLIDARGEDGVAGTPEGGNGGTVRFIYAAPSILMVPTVYARGGDVDTADISLSGGGPVGGNGGDVVIETAGGNVFVCGGVGPIVNNTRIPTWRSDPIDPMLLTVGWAGDYLPPSPPRYLSSFGSSNPAIGVRTPLRWGINQVGFARGLLTTGGMGGTGLATSSANRNGGQAGDSGDISITLGAPGLLIFRDIDLITGVGPEILTHRYKLPPPASAGKRLVCTAAGAHGGFGQNIGSRGGDGGSGGDAGAITVSGGTLDPMPASFIDLYEIRAFPSGGPLLDSDLLCSRGRNAIGNIIEARSATGAPLYRLRLNTAGTALLGGQGGIPSGRLNPGYPGDVGPAGAPASVTGIPVQ